MKSFLKLKSFKLHIETEVEAAFAEDEPVANPALELADMYFPYTASPVEPRESKEIRYIDAITDGLRLGMQQHDNLILMGQDIAEYGGAFKITDGFVSNLEKQECAIHPFANQQS